MTRWEYEVMMEIAEREKLLVELLAQAAQQQQAEREEGR